MHKFENYLFTIENDYYLKEAVLSFLNNNHLWYEHLLENGYLKYNGSLKKVAFAFVGVIVFADNIIAVLPKYFDTEDISRGNLKSNIDEIKLIIKVLKKAGKVSDITPDFYNFNTANKLNTPELAIADSLIKDYLENGIYRKEIAISVINQEGEINWNNTIENTIPIFSGRYPIYVDVYSTSHIQQQHYLITEIHKWAVKTCMNKYGCILDYNISFDEDYIRNFNELGHDELILNLLKNELNQIFTDRNINLIKNLIAFISKQISHNGKGLEIFGTRYFHTIWEQACKSIFNNRISNYIEEIPFPTWSDLDGNHVCKDSLEPDVISVNGSYFFILDAKYYIIKFSNTNPLKLYDNPGVADVSKQLLYERAFVNLTFDYKHNCFVYPRIQEEFFKIFGYTEFALFPNMKIWNLYLSTIKVFNYYLKNEIEGEVSLPDISAEITRL